MESKYFGPPMLRKEHEVQIPTPVGATCILCSEVVCPGDVGTVNSISQVAHHECQIRSVVGSVAHQQKRCSCYGGDADHDDGLTFRESAKSALTYFMAHQRSNFG